MRSELQGTTLRKTPNAGSSKIIPLDIRGIFIYNKDMEGFVLYQISQYHSLPLNGLHILDCGCGEGDNALALAKQGAELTLLDKSQNNLDKTINKLVSGGFLVRSITTNLEDWTPDMQYDIVIFTNVLHLISKERREQALTNALSSLKPGGTLIFTYLTDDSPLPEHLRNYILEHLESVEHSILEGIHLAYDLPHKGMDIPHKHYIHFIVGTKK